MRQLLSVFFVSLIFMSTAAMANNATMKLNQTCGVPYKDLHIERSDMPGKRIMLKSDLSFTIELLPGQTMVKVKPVVTGINECNENAYDGCIASCPADYMEQCEQNCAIEYGCDAVVHAKRFTATETIVSDGGVVEMTCKNSS